MALKRTSRSRKRELEQPDQFETYSHKFMQFILKHKVQVSTALGIIVGLCVIAVGMRYFAFQAENKAFYQLGQALNKYQTLIEQNRPEKAYLDVEKDFQMIVQKYSKNNGGKLARFVYANICYQAGNYDRAIAFYNQSLKDFIDHPFLKNLAVSNLAYSHEAKKEYDTAAKFFEMIVSTPDSGLKDEALFNLGGIYAVTGDNEKRNNALKKIISDHTDSIYFEIAKERVAG
ncbi:MAG: tetratricopeptide repeat protein [Proteobacteria bacterium]|nr:tetratricopeptide repeat protein [Pseudomonadota bacterium]